jgi:uncharacterized protein (DUF433 family)
LKEFPSLTKNHIKAALEFKSKVKWTWFILLSKIKLWFML